MAEAWFTTDQLTHALDQGWPVTRTARELGVSEYRVRRACAAAGVTLPRGRAGPARVEIDSADAYRRYVAGESLRSIARSLGLSASTAARRVRVWARRGGLSWPPVVLEPVGQRCYDAYRRLRSWGAVAAEVMPESSCANPGRAAMLRALRWARTMGQPWPVGP